MLSGVYLALLRLSSDKLSVCVKGSRVDNTAERVGTGVAGAPVVVGTGGGAGNRDTVREGGRRGGWRDCLMPDEVNV